MKKKFSQNQEISGGWGRKIKDLIAWPKKSLRNFHYRRPLKISHESVY